MSFVCLLDQATAMQLNYCNVSMFDICSAYFSYSGVTFIQVAERAIEVYGSADQIEKEKNKKLEKREKVQQKKFEKNVKGWFSIVS